MLDLLISGSIVDPVDGVYEGTILVKGERIEDVKNKITDLDAKQKLELPESCYIFPGFIDAHVHLREPGWEHKEDFLTGSKAALHGGVTAVGDMPNLPIPITTKDALSRKMELAKKSLIDVFHYGGVGKDLSHLKEIAPLVPVFKIYTAESTGDLTLRDWDQIDEAVDIISRLGKTVSFHCEHQHINDEAKESLRDKNYAWKHCDERPEESEITAVKNVISMCIRHDLKGNIAHTSTKTALDIVDEGRLSGANITCEVTPHHLFFTKKDMEKLGPLLKVNCPLRDEKDRLALLDGLRTGKIDMFATDHAPHTLEEKRSANPPSGMPQLDTYGNIVLWLMLKQKFSPQRVAEITSYNPARFLGLRDRAQVKKGFLANFTILDTKGETEIRNSDMRTKCGWSPFAGIVFPGKVTHTITHGKIYSNIRE